MAVTEVKEQMLDARDEEALAEARAATKERIDHSSCWIALCFDPDDQTTENGTTISVMALTSHATAGVFMNCLHDAWMKLVQEYPDVALMLTLERVAAEAVTDSDDLVMQ